MKVITLLKKPQPSYFKFPGGFQCTCAHGYTGNQCQYDLNECLSLPCQHNGRCAEDGIGSFKCYCPEGYNGTQCEQKLSGDGGSSMVLVGSSSAGYTMAPTVESTGIIQPSGNATPLAKI